MSYGMTVNGDNNRLLFSTNVNGMFFQGKANLHTVFPDSDSGQLITVDYSTQPFTNRTYFDIPNATTYEFRITLSSSVTSIMPFVHNTVGKRVAFLTVYKLNSTDWQIYVYACTNPNTTGNFSSTTNIPQVYVFSDFISGSTNTGYGVNTFNETGKATFSSNAKPLIFKALYNGNVRFSNLSLNQDFPFSWIGNGPAYNQNISFYNSVLPTSSISKPAIFFSGNQTTRRRNDNTGTVFVFEATARFLASTSQLAVEWARVFTTFSLGGVNQQSTSPSFTALVIDAAQYD